MMLSSLRTSLRFLGQHMASNAVKNGQEQTRGLFLCARAMSSTATTSYDFQTLNVSTPSDYVKHVELNRPEKRNAMNTAFWGEMIDCFNKLAVDEDCRVVVLSGSGKLFTAGLDLTDNAAFPKVLGDDDIGQKAYFLATEIRKMQESFNVIEKCPKPVIAAVHSACVGGGIDMISACDIRYCTDDAWFQIKEIDLGLAADLGTLQRFPRLVGNDSLTRELVYTARKFYSDEAKSMGFVSRVLPDKDQMMKAAMDTATVIASKSPVGVQGSKVNLVYSRDHSIPDGLHNVATWNLSMLQSEDVKIAAAASLSRTTPVFSKL